jgi:pimeloyl-ACP methyl ester carboxylesterase
MSVFVLVHGAWHGGWCWERVAVRLRQAGHDVLAPTLTGLAERAGQLTPEVGLRTHVNDVAEQLGGLRQPAILVGHSYAGIVVRETAERMPMRVSRLVLVEAWLAGSGQSLLSVAPPWFAEGIWRLADERGRGWRIPPPAPAAVGVTDPDDVAWVEAQLTDHPLRTFSEPTQLNGSAPMIPAHALVASGGAPLPFAEWADALGAQVETIEGGHDLMVTSSEALTAKLLSLA